MIKLYKCATQQGLIAAMKSGAKKYLIFYNKENIKRNAAGLMNASKS